MNTIAITRKISRNINMCQLTHINRVPININRAIEQHNTYEKTLKLLGVNVISLPQLDEYPDSVFVEDCAFVVDECAIITRPGAPSRLHEPKYLENTLAKYRKNLKYIVEPGILDGGDILRIGKEIYVGLSNRSNIAAVHQLQSYLEPHNYQVTAIPLSLCLHLKSAATVIGNRTLLVNPKWINKNDFANDIVFIDVDESENHAANAILLPCDTIVYSTSFPKTSAKLTNYGFNIVHIPTDELSKAEGAISCCSLVFKSDFYECE